MTEGFNTAGTTGNTPQNTSAQPVSAQNAATSTDATKMFRIPSQDATLPDLMSAQKHTYPTLSIMKGPQAGMSFDLDQSLITLGRDPSNSIFLNDMTVSRHHAQIDLSNVASGFATIEDLSSLNGTWVNGAIVTQVQITDGATIQIGTFYMVFHLNATS